MKKLLVLLGAIALTFTLATAEGKCGNSKKEVKCQSGKCGKSDKKDMKCQAGKCGATDKNDTKKVPKKGKCGQGKCG